MLISLVICTRNRRRKLETLLRSLDRLDLFGDFTCEVVVVDNNSTDDTKDLVEEVSKASSLIIKYAFEAIPGLGQARNRGLSEARGDVLAFTDDDCIPEPDWVRMMAAKFSAEPSLAGLGGRVELYDESDQPVTIRRKREIADLESDYRLFSLIAGCNMAFRRQVFDEIGSFDAVFGAGTKIASGEDSDFLYRAHKKGLTIRYYPDVLVYHDHGRKADAEVNALLRGYGSGRGAFYCKHILLGDRVVMKMAVREVISLVRMLTRNLMAGHPIDRQKAASYGLFWGVIRGLPIFLRRAITATPSSTRR